MAFLSAAHPRSGPGPRDADHAAGRSTLPGATRPGTTAPAGSTHPPVPLAGDAPRFDFGRIPIHPGAPKAGDTGRPTGTGPRDDPAPRDGTALGGGAVRRLVGPGGGLPSGVRAEEEARFGVDLGDVRLHHGPAAHRLAQGQLARAFTVGTDIVFNKGRYQPGAQEGRRLLAHELAHVVQQRPVAGAAPPGPAHEAAAHAAAHSVLSGAGPVSAGPASAMTVACEPLSPEEIAELALEPLRARIAENEREASPLVISEEYLNRLAAEHTQLELRYAELTRAPGSQAAASGTAPQASGPQATSPPTAAPQATSSQAAPPQAAAPQAGEPDAAVLEQIDTEFAEVEALVVRLAADVTANPQDHALNEVRGVAARLDADVRFVAAFVPQDDQLAAAAVAAGTRFRTLRATFAPVVATAQTWHEDNPAGESLGMWNERQGTALAGAGLAEWEQGGLHALSGGALMAGAGGVAVLDAGERLLSLGFHDAATAVSQAYTRGDISWSEGEAILTSAAWRALLTAAVTRGAGAATSRLGAAAAGSLGLAPEALGYGVVAGGVSGGLGSAVTLGTQSALTAAMRDGFTSPAARAIWDQGMPQGRDWAVAIPLSMLLGGAFGARSVAANNAALIGTVVDTPGGPARIILITPGGQVVLEPVTGTRAPPPPAPPPSEVVLVYDPATESWRAPQGTSGAPAGDLTPLPPGPALPATLPAVLPTTPPPAAPLSSTPLPSAPLSSAPLSSAPLSSTPLPPAVLPPAVLPAPATTAPAPEPEPEPEATMPAPAPAMPAPTPAPAPAPAAPTAAGPPAPVDPFAALTDRRLRALARTDPDAAQALWLRYRALSDRQLADRARRGDETARAVQRQRIPANTALPGILASESRMPHEAHAVAVDALGNVLWDERLSSGQMTPAESALEFPLNTQATHTEARAVARAPLVPGGTLYIVGQYNPCQPCQDAMRAAANSSGATIIYWWPGGEMRFTAQPAPPAPPPPAAPAGP